MFPKEGAHLLCRPLSPLIVPRVLIEKGKIVHEDVKPALPARLRLVLFIVGRLEVDKLLHPARDTREAGGKGCRLRCTSGEETAWGERRKRSRMGSLADETRLA